MKKVQFSLVVVFLGISLITDAQIPNSSFESWTAGNPDGWSSSNIFQLGLVNVTQTADCHSGSSAVRGEVVDFMGAPMGPIIQSGPDAAGFAISEQYLSFELYYKFTSVNGDRFSVNVALSKEGNPIAQGAVALPASVNAYTHLTVPLDYTVSDVPDRAYIQISISGPVTGPDYHIGSVMYADDLAFSFLTGINSQAVPGKTPGCYPNPASDIINIQLDEDLSGGFFIKIFDTFGREIRMIAGQQGPPGNVFQFSVSDLSPGLYFYSIDKQSLHYSGKLNVNR